MAFSRPLQKIAELGQTANRKVSLAELGIRGAWRFGQTMVAVCPRAIKCLVQKRKPSPAEVRALFEDLGATYIKFGQFIASSPSIFPKEYVEEFRSCLDQTKQISFAQICRIIEADLGHPITEVFSHLDSSALASASIAQVHAATLITGEDVVIKVQKPGVQAIITTDLNTVFLITRLMELILPALDKEAITGIVSEMYQAMIDECDFEKEAQNLLTFGEFLQRSENTGVVVPRPFLQASGSKVLTMARIYGVSLTDEEYLSSHRDACAESLFCALNTWYASLTQCEFFHADLHSGNMILMADGRVGFIDFGMVGRIKKEVWRAVFDLFNALTIEDYSAIAANMIIIGITRETVFEKALATDIEKLFTGMEAVDPVIAAGNSNDNINQLVSELGAIAKRYGIRFPRVFTLLLKQFLYFDRYMNLLAPGADMFRDERVHPGF